VREAEKKLRAKEVGATEAESWIIYIISILESHMKLLRSPEALKQKTEIPEAVKNKNIISL
jgi:hypothetical protein